MSDQERIALVTGAAGNLGKAVVAALGATGDRVIEVLRDRAQLGAETLPVDLLDIESCERLMAAVTQRYGGVYAAVHTVGTFTWTGSIEQAELDAFRAIYETNVLTSVAFLRAVVPAMKRAGEGRIVLIASSAARAGAANVAAYSASKAAQLRIVESVADELRGTGITVNAVLPGVMDTPQNRAAMPNADRSRWVTPAKVADVVRYLVSEGAGAVTGEAVGVGEG